jgi:hypothetical protein
VGNVGAIEPLALLDECLGPDDFFGRAEPHRHFEDLIADRVLEPLVVDPRDAVA